MRQLFVYSIVFFINFNIQAQYNVYNSLYIKEIEIVSNRLENFVTGNRIEKIDSLSKEIFKHDNLSDVLSNLSIIPIKSYGVSGISSASIRGTNSNQMAVLWNGFNLQDPLTASLGLNLIPIQFIDDISIQYGGSSSLFGSSAIGGVIHLNNKADFNTNTNIEFNSSYGSFNTYNTGLNLSFSNKNFNSKFRAFYKTSENNFSFINTSKYGHPEEVNQNSDVESKGFLQENFYRFSDFSQICSHYWYQQTYRQVPKNMSSDAGEAYQQDNWHKVAVKYYKEILNADFYFKSGFFYNSTHYVDNEVFVDAFHSSVQTINEAEIKINLNNSNILNFGLNNTYTQGNSESFLNKEDLNNFAGFFSYKFKSENNRIVFITSLREEVIDNQFIEPNFSIGANFILANKFESKINFSKNFRAPTFNDLFWLDAFARGNPDLKPENAYTLEIALVYSPFNQKKLLNIEFSLFYNYISDLILWQPVFNIWTPINLKENLAKGIELNMSGLAKINKFQLNYKASYSYTKSTIEKITENESENLLHNQLAYVPFHNVSANVSVSYKKISLSFIQNFVGKRYADASNLRELDAYFIGNVHFSYNVEASKFKINTFLKINNIWNTNYQSVYLYPNPLRSYEIGFSLNFRKDS